MIKTRVTGLDAVIRSYDRKRKEIEDALTEGTEEAGDHLIEAIEDKFGKYQPGWAKLKYETMLRKADNNTKPLIEYADMMFSFYKIVRVRSRKHVVHVVSDDPKIVHHVYGAPRANVPKRDPVRPTTKEENDACIKIIRDAVRRIL